MIFARMTPKYAGLSILGDYMDLEHLYDALHEVVGEEGEYRGFGAARLRVLGLCYDLRHALMGDRELEFVDNGMTPDKMQRLATIAPQKNVYLAVQIVWPEAIFVTAVLNEFIRMHLAKKVKRTDPTDGKVIFDPTIAQIRLLQVTVVSCLKEHVSEASFARLLTPMGRGHRWYEDYATQYVDLLNVRFLNFAPDKRLKSLSTMVKRLAEYGDEYDQIRRGVAAAALEHNCSALDIVMTGTEWPDTFEW